MSNSKPFETPEHEPSEAKLSPLDIYHCARFVFNDWQKLRQENYPSQQFYYLPQINSLEQKIVGQRDMRKEMGLPRYAFWQLGNLAIEHSLQPRFEPEWEASVYEAEFSDRQILVTSNVGDGVIGIDVGVNCGPYFAFRKPVLKVEIAHDKFTYDKLADAPSAVYARDALLKESINSLFMPAGLIVPNEAPHEAKVNSTLAILDLCDAYYKSRLLEDYDAEYMKSRAAVLHQRGFDHLVEQPKESLG